MLGPTLITAAPAPDTRTLERLRRSFAEADAILVGAGAGLSTAAGHAYAGERFERALGPWRERYGITDMYSGGFFPFPTLEEFWGYWSRMILVNRYDGGPGGTYTRLVRLLEGKDAFVVTTNVDHCFQRAGIDRHRLYYMQGDYGLFQCSVPCHRATYDNEDAVRTMCAAVDEKLVAQRAAGVPGGALDLGIPSELIPRCPVCGEPMTTNLRIDGTFVEDEGWHAAEARYADFRRCHVRGRVLYLELGVGGNTPGIIKYPFWQMTAANPDAVYACVNAGEACCLSTIEHQSILVNADINVAIEALEG
ncbi:MAG: Sir2 silent information regulator family NAD-dependent deacetylase [Collinsella sp.]|nr:Sir2 silent information regulator family NAD-dependent deacetylase [Collinsella sp.]